MTKLFLFFLVAKGLTETFLEMRNKNYILKNRHQVPERFRSQISLEEHQKAADYTLAKRSISLVFDFCGVLILLLWTIWGGINALDHLARSFEYGPLFTGVIFFGFFGLISLFLSLPQSLYMTFIIEERFGFNKTTLKMFFVDLFKGLLLGVVLGLPLLTGLLWIMGKLGQFWWVYAFGFLTAFQLLLLWIYPTWIAPLFNKFTPLEEGETKEKILALLKRTDFQSDGLFIMDASKRSSHGNAYFTGFGKNKRIVFFDNLIKTLTPSQIEAVLAHELGHFKKKHIVKGLIKSLILSFVGFAVLGFLINWQPFYQGHGVEMMSDHTALLLFSMVSGVYTFWTTPLSAWSSRKHEFEADQFAAQHSSAQELIEALVKLYKDNASTLTPDPLFSSYYHSHPPALIRVQHLEKL